MDVFTKIGDQNKMNSNLITKTRKKQQLRQ